MSNVCFCLTHWNESQPSISLFSIFHHHSHYLQFPLFHPIRCFPFRIGASPWWISECQKWLTFCNSVSFNFLENVAAIASAIFFFVETGWAKTYTALRHSQSEVRSENKAWIEVGPARVTSATQITERETKLVIETIT